NIVHLPVMLMNPYPASSFFFSIIRRPPSSPLFPYTTLFRSVWTGVYTFTLAGGQRGGQEVVALRGTIFPPGHPDPATVDRDGRADRKSTRLNSSHDQTSYAVFCLKKKTHRM